MHPARDGAKSGHGVPALKSSPGCGRSPGRGGRDDKALIELPELYPSHKKLSPTSADAAIICPIPGFAVIYKNRQSFPSEASHMEA